MSYSQKDIEKFRGTDVLISQGAKGSSSDKYSKGEILQDIGAINIKDPNAKTVGVSINGVRRGRISFNKDLVDYYISIGAKFIQDNQYHRERSFNIGERELAEYLYNNGYYVAQDNRIRALWVKSELPTYEMQYGTIFETKLRELSN